MAAGALLQQKTGVVRLKSPIASPIARTAITIKPPTNRLYVVTVFTRLWKDRIGKLPRVMLKN